MEMPLMLMFLAVSGVDLGQCIKPDDRPNLPTLRKFEKKNGRTIDFAEQIGVDCETFGLHLLQDDSGAVVDGIKHTENYRSVPVCNTIFRKFLAGKGRRLPSWRAFVDALRDTQLFTLAQDIEQQYETVSIRSEVKHDQTNSNIENSDIEPEYMSKRTKVESRTDSVADSHRGRHHEITDFWMLYTELATIGNWEALCHGLGGQQIEWKINELRHTQMEASMKKFWCLEAFLKLGDVYWEDVVRVVSSYPIEDVRLANRIESKFVTVDRYGRRDEL